MLEEFHDLPPEQAEFVKAQMRIPNEMVQPMFDVLERGRVSPGVGEKLGGLLPPKDIDHVVQILMRPPWEARRAADEGVASVASPRRTGTTPRGITPV